MRWIFKILGFIFLIGVIVTLTEKQYISTVIWIVSSGLCLFFGFQKKNVPIQERDRTSVRRYYDDVYKTEQGLADDYYCFLLKIIMCKIKQFYEENYLPNVDTKIDALLEKLSEVRKIYRPQDHIRFVKVAINRYMNDFNEMPDEYQIGLIENIFQFDIERIRKKQYLTVVRDFTPYWDEQLSLLVQKRAIINRREYLIERCVEMINLCNKHGYDEMSMELENYKSIQKNMIAEEI